MSTVEEIEAAIEKLTEDAQWELAHRLDARLWDAWDEEIKVDAEAGRFDHLVAEVESDIVNDRLKPLNEIIDNS